MSRIRDKQWTNFLRDELLKLQQTTAMRKLELKLNLKKKKKSTFFCLKIFYMYQSDRKFWQDCYSEP